MAKKVAKKSAEKKVVKKSSTVIPAHLSSVIVRPHVTEKAAYAGEHSVYTFLVAPNANKTEIKKAIKALYGVTPTKVATVTMKSIQAWVRGRKGTEKGYKKAMVYLPKGQTIEFI